MNLHQKGKRVNLHKKENENVISHKEEKRK